MEDSNASARNKESKLFSAILMTWAIAGTMDILAALVPYMIRTGNGPVKILEYIASGLFGQETAYSGSALMAISGLAIHYVIALCWTCLFFFTYPKLSLLRGNKYVVGIAYGILVWAIMNLVILPLTRIPAITFNPSRAAIACLILIACIGTPISLMAHRYYSGSAK